LRPGSVAATVPAGCGCGVASGGASLSRAAVPGARTGISGVEAMVPGGDTGDLEAGAKTVLLSAECCLLAREVLDPPKKCGAVGG
jgi:hypothetical protein